MSNCRMEELACCAAEPQFSSTTLFQLTKSEKFRPSILVVPTSSSTSRRYALSRTSSDNRTQYFSCKRCYYLNNRRPVDGVLFSVRLYIVDGVFHVPKDAVRHPECEPLLGGAGKFCCGGAADRPINVRRSIARNHRCKRSVCEGKPYSSRAVFTRSVDLGD